MNKKLMVKVAIVAMSLSVASFSSGATVTLEVGPVYLDSVSVIGPTAFGHAAGNLEIKVTNGITVTGCDSNYITTRNDVTNYKEMLSVLLAAQIAQKPVRLGITNNEALTAFGGRCSLVSVALLK